MLQDTRISQTSQWNPIGLPLILGEYASVLFYAFVQKELIDDVTSAIDKLKASQESLSRVHVVVLDIKKMN
jgi:hypothetical protein